MSKELLDLDSVIEEFEEVVIEEKPDTSKGVAIVPKKSMPSSVSVNLRESLELIDEPEKLFDFSDTNLTPLQQTYIVAYAACGVKSKACKIAGIPYRVVNRWLENEEFNEALQNAVDIVTDCLEEELIRRAMAGSDKLLLEAIKARRKDYQPKSSQDVNVRGEIVHTWSELAKQAAIEVTEYEEVDDDDD